VDEEAKRGKTQRSAGKVIASVFWYAHGIIFIDYLEKGQTINSDYYIALLERLNAEIKKKRPHLKKKKVLFHQDNALCHKSNKTTAKLHELSYELLPHPPYSPDRAPSDLFLFANLKKMRPFDLTDDGVDIDLPSREEIEGALKYLKNNKTVDLIWWMQYMK
jgi:hypothetical protein